MVNLNNSSELSNTGEDIIVTGYDEDKLEFYWTRPPYPDDTIWKKAEIIGVTPKNPLEPIHPGAYFDCFTILPYDN